MATEVKQYTVTDIVKGIANKGENEQKIKITVPKIQRNLVWSKEQKHKFIDTLKRGYPFGSLLLYKKENENSFSLIDGLQRTSTILHYSNIPTNFFSGKEIDSKYIHYFINRVPGLSQNDSDEICNVVEKWVHDLKGFDEGDNFSSYDLVRKIQKEMGLFIDQDIFDDIVNEFREFTTKIKKESDISNIQIPVIVYYGDENNLPDIFERINSKGTKLNKYQIFAATWRKTLPISNEEIIHLIEAKYEKLIDEGFEIENYNPDDLYSDEAEFTLFEYLFGLGKYFSTRFPHLFGKYMDDKADTTDSIGFNLTTLCCGIPITKMSNLQSSISKFDIQKLEDAMIDSINFVDEALNSILSFRAHRSNKKDKDGKIYHTEFQIVSLISSVFHLKYDDKLQVRPSWKENQKKLSKNIPMYYLLDILRDTWTGSGDSKLKENVLKDNLETTSRYLSPIRKTHWESTLQEWFEDQLNRSETNRVPNYDKDILFLKYLYKNILTHEESHRDHEVDHVYSVARLKEAAKKIGGLPISCVANLTMINKELNRSKKEKSYPEFFQLNLEKGDLKPSDVAKKLDEIEKVTFTYPGDIDFPKDRNNKDQITKSWYIKTLRERFDKMRTFFVEEVMK